MAEYIERSSIKYEQWAVGPLNEPLMVVRKKTIDSIPAADVAPVRHGRWKHDHYENCTEQFEIVKCSNCGATAYAMAFYVKSGNYCPNCGAKMDLEGGGRA